MKAWHFTSDRLRDGRPLPEIGEWLEHEGPLELCASGLHASRRPLDALRYAPGPRVSRVDVEDFIAGDDKLVARRRRALWCYDATEALRRFAWLCALDVIHLWDAPDVVRRYLRSGDPSLRDAAKAAVWDGARDGARDAGARDVAWAAVAWDGARDAAWDAAARAAAWADARDAAWAAVAWDGAWDAARDAARADAWADARDAAWAAARAAAWADARDAAREKQNRRLTRMLLQGRHSSDLLE